MIDPSALTGTVIAMLILHLALLRLRVHRETQLQIRAPKSSGLHLLATGLATIAGLSAAFLYHNQENVMGMYLFFAYLILGGLSTLISFNGLDTELHRAKTGGQP